MKKTELANAIASHWWGVTVSPWHHHTVNPTRPGSYEVDHNRHVHHNNKKKLHGKFRYWDGKQWYNSVALMQPTIFGTHDSHVWRGVLRWDRRGNLLLS